MAFEAKTRPTGLEEGKGSKVARLVQLESASPSQLSSLTRAGLGSSLQEVTARVKEWRPAREELTNEIVMDLYGKSDNCVMNELVRVCMFLLCMHESHFTKPLKQRMKLLFSRTRQQLEKQGGSLTDPWLYLTKLEEGGDMHDPSLLAPHSRRQGLGLRLHKPSQDTRCWHTECSREEGDLRMCPSCLTAMFCSTDCLQSAMTAGHSVQCE